MARKRFTTESIIGMLREAEVRLAEGQTIGVICNIWGSRSRAITAGAGTMAGSSSTRRNG
jgi:hypothetical protein